MRCIECECVRREAVVRGRVIYRCMNPEGRLVDPVSGAPAGSTVGFAVDRPVPEGADPWKMEIGAPAWCPRRRGVGEGSKPSSR